MPNYSIALSIYHTQLDFGHRLVSNAFKILITVKHKNHSKSSPMLWLEKYKPKSFKEITSHKEILDTLRNYTLENIPNLIFHGQVGHNKKTIVYSLIEHLYGKFPVTAHKTVEMDINNTEITVNYLESDEMVEMCPSDYGLRDRHVVQRIIKDMAQSKPIMSMFSTSRRNIKILIIDQSESLSRDAQASLRRTMEIYSSHFRIFMICNESSKLIEPIKSRCLLIRVRAFTEEELACICENILEKESQRMRGETIKEIISNSKGNCKRALCLLELCCFNGDESNPKRVKTDASSFKLEWETKIDKVVELIKTRPRIETMALIRKEFYELLNSGITADIILLYMVRGLSKGSFETIRTISAFALNYDERIRVGSKPLYHLEAFAASVLCIFSSR